LVQLPLSSTAGHGDAALAPGGKRIREIIEALPASKITEVSALAFGDPRVIPLWFGEGDLTTPAFIGEAAAAALRAGQTFYTYTRGVPMLRQAIAEYETRLRGRTLAPERVSVTSAGMGAIMLAVQALVDAGDNFVIVDPVWPNIKAAVQILGGEPRAVPLMASPEGGWRLDLERVFAACDRRTRAIFVNSPGNPTGWVMGSDSAAALLEFARQRGIWLISDEVYERFVYDGSRAAPSLLDIADPEDRVIVINSFSKSWAMTGWRLGWLVGPPVLDPVLDNLIQFNTSGAATFLQHAAVAALRDGETFVAGMVERCRVGRDLVVQGLARFPRVRVTAPEGAFYVFFAVDGVGDSLAFAKEIVTRCQVGLAPGIAFGPAGEGYLRLCFASAPERLGAALDRLAPALS
jgi:aspartate aminotransferase